MDKLLQTFVSDERGTETVEWGVMAGLVVGGLILTVASIGAWVHGRFTSMDEDLRAHTP